MGTFLQILAVAAGLALLYMAGFLYEDTEGRLQNRLEEWWIRLDDLHHLALARHVAFMRVVGEWSDLVLNRIFGTALLSGRAFTVSAGLSLASVFLFGEAVDRFNELDFTTTLPDNIRAIGAVGVNAVVRFIAATLLIALSIAAGRSDRAYSALKFTIGYILVSSLYFYPFENGALYDFVLDADKWVIQQAAGTPFQTIFGYMNDLTQSTFDESADGPLQCLEIWISWPYRNAFLLWSFDLPSATFVRFDTAPIIAAILPGIACDIVAVAVGRRLIRWSVDLRTVVRISAVIATAALVGVAMVVVPIAGGSAIDSPTLIAVGASNLLDGVTALFYMGLATIMLVHRLVWPLLERPIYAAARHGLIRRRRVLASTGLMLVAAGNAKIAGLLHALIERTGLL